MAVDNKDLGKGERETGGEHSPKNDTKPFP